MYRRRVSESFRGGEWLVGSSTVDDLRAGSGRVWTPATDMISYKHTFFVLPTLTVDLGTYSQAL